MIVINWSPLGCASILSTCWGSTKCCRALELIGSSLYLLLLIFTVMIKHQSIGLWKPWLMTIDTWRKRIWLYLYISKNDSQSKIFLFRLQTGMRGAYGKAHGTAARVRIGQILLSVRSHDKFKVNLRCLNAEWTIDEENFKDSWRFAGQNAGPESHMLTELSHWETLCCMCWWLLMRKCSLCFG